MKLLLATHTFFQSLRHTFVLAGFGSISYCKHSPTCSEYCMKAIQKEGYVLGLLKGTWRVLRCW